MQFLSIGVNRDTDDIINQIKNELEKLETGKINYSVQNEVNSNAPTYIVCSLNDENEANEGIRESNKSTLVFHISNVLADYIIKKYEEKLIARTISSNYCYFNSIEKK